MTKRKFEDKEGPEYGVDSRYTSKKERIVDGKALMKARLDRMNNFSKEEIIRAKLLQLKFKMEEYIKQPVFENHNFFTEFLTSYIDSLYKKRSDFAKDIDITPVRLSQVLNNHREPKEEFMLRLMIHSEKAYQNVCEFHKMTWYQVYYHEKICDTIASQDKWRPKVEQHVKVKNLINS